MRDRAVIVVGVMLGLAGGAGGIVTDAVPAVLILGVFVLAGHVVMLPDRGGRHRTAAPAVVVAAAVLDVPVVAIACALAWGAPLGWLAARIAYGERAGGDAGAATAVGGAVFVASFAIVHGAIGHVTTSLLAAHLTASVLGAVAWFGGAVWVTSQRAGRRERARRRTTMRREIDAWPVQAALIAIGALFGLTLEPLGWVAATVMAGLPYGFVHLSLARLDRARSTFASTVQALGRIPEAGGYTPMGRSERVTGLSVGIGAELGLRPRQLEILEQATRLHALGTVVLNDPSIARSAPSEHDLAQWGAAIVGESPSLGPVASVISMYLEPYRRDGEARRDDVPMEARVLRVALAYDTASGRSRQVEAALDELHRGMTYDFDPDVVAALRHHLVRRGLIAA